MGTTALVLAIVAAQDARVPRHAAVDFTPVPRQLAVTTHISVHYHFDGFLYDWGTDLAQVHDRRPTLYETFVDGFTYDGIRMSVDDSGMIYRLYGYDDPDRGYVVIDRCDVWTRGLKAHQRPRVTNPPPRPVAFQFLRVGPTLPADTTFTLGLRRPDGSKAAVEVRAPAGATPADVAAAAAKQCAAAGLKAEAKGVRVEVVGWPGKDGAVTPALGGTVRAAGHPADRQPQVSGPPAPLPRAVLDLSAVPADPKREVAVRLQAAAGGAAFDKVVRAAGRAALVRAVEAELVDEHFQAWAEGDRVIVYGWADVGARLRTITGAWASAPDLPDGQRPRVELQGDLPPPTAPAPRPKS